MALLEQVKRREENRNEKREKEIASFWTSLLVRIEY
jgi:hypothetical protein